MAGAVAAVERMVKRRDGRMQLVVTVNPEFVMRARADEQFRSVLEGAALALPDGAGVVWAMRRHGCPQPGRVTGIDLVSALATVCARRAWRPFLLGARPGVAQEAARRLELSHPGLRIAGAHAGSPHPEDDAESVGLIASARPHLLFVAYGAPLQELWIARNRHRLDVPVAVGVGGALDFLAARVPRAPGWLQRADLEWLWRLAVQPWRARRMAVLPAFALAVLREPRR